MDIFSNRELAVIIWSSIVLCYLLYKGFKKSFKEVISSVLQTKLIVPIILSAIYTSLIIFLLELFSFWDTTLLKDSFFWFFFIGVILQFKLVIAENQSKLFNSIFFENLKLLVVLEFIINFYSFSLVVELILIPFLAFIAMLEVVAESESKYSSVTKIIHWVQVIFGYVILLYALFEITSNMDAFLSFQTLNSFLFPIALSILYLPYLYFFVLYINYESLFARLKMGAEKSKELNRAAKKEIFRHCLFSIKKTKKALNMSIFNLMSIRDMEDVEEMSKAYEAKL